MADSKKGIPSWQKQAAPTPTEADVDQAKEVKSGADTAAASPASSEDRTNLIEQARTFLGHEEIQDATTESKISFLEEKGLTNEEIHQLLGISRNEPAAPEPAATVVDEATQSNTPAVASSPAPATSVSSQSEPSAPPIITYPEFLLHASKPPPLVTPARALKAVYGASLLGGAIYGASKFVLQPMYESLSEARHDLFAATREQLEPLNTKLEQVVSTIPPAALASNVGHERRGEDEDDDSSIASDPTEMFHRDMGVQTSAPSSPLLSAQDAEGAKQTATEVAAGRLKTLHESLSSLLESANSTLESAEAPKQALKDTDIYLDQLRYGEGGPGYVALAGEDSWRAQVFGKQQATAAGKKADAVEELKADIRAMKGAMLSARNFPRSVR